MRISDWSSDVCSSDLIGSDIEASILDTAALEDLGVANIWAKAVTKAHGRILERVGAHHVIYPEHDMGHRVAHLLGGRMIDWLQLDEQFALVETVVPRTLAGQTLQDVGVRAAYGVTVVCRSAEHTSELQSQMRISYAVSGLKKQT